MHKVIFDCNIFAQALMKPLGPAGACLDAALIGQVLVFISDAVIAEIRDIPNKPTPARAGVTPETVETLVQLLLQTAQHVAIVPPVFLHPIDEDDSAYVNLALAAGAELIVSRDRHLLNLSNPAKPWSAAFRSLFPDLKVITPEQLLAEIRQANP